MCNRRSGPPAGPGSCSPQGRAAALRRVGGAALTCPPPSAWESAELSQGALFAETPTGSLPLLMPRGGPAASGTPIPTAAFQRPILLEARALGTPCGGHPSWPRPSLFEQRRVCTQACPGPPSPLGLQAFLGAEDRNQPCVFQAARLLRNSRLSPETPSPTQPRPLSEKRIPAPLPASFLFSSEEGEGSGEGLQPYPWCHPFGPWPVPHPSP